MIATAGADSRAREFGGRDMNSVFLLRTCAALVLLAPALAFAQATQGGLEGSASPGDSVTIRNILTEHHLATGVAENGRFHFRRLPIGVYEVVIHHRDGSM